MTFRTRLTNVARRIDRRLRPPQRGPFELADVTEPEWRIIRAVGDRTMTSPERLISLMRTVEYLEGNGIDGDIVECGVFRGGSVMAASLRLMDLGATDRDLYLYDTFEGMPTPGAEDIDVHGQSAAEPFTQLQLSETSSNWARAALDEVQENVFGTGYPRHRFHFVQGMVEDTLPKVLPERIALLRLDTDWYESTRHELEHLFPRLVPGGVLIIDDYGHFQGAAKAVDEYVATLPTPCSWHASTTQPALPPSHHSRQRVDRHDSGQAHARI